MSCSWWQAWITEPAPRKSMALNPACVTKWYMEADASPVLAPNPTAMTIRPNCDKVE